MTNKFLISVSALVLGVAMSSAAMADAGNGNLEGNVALGGPVSSTTDHDGVTTTTYGNSTAVDTTTNLATTTKSDDDTYLVNYGSGNAILSNNDVASGNSSTKDVSVTDTSDTTISKDNGNRVLSGNSLGSRNTDSVTISKTDTSDYTKVSYFTKSDVEQKARIADNDLTIYTTGSPASTLSHDGDASTVYGAGTNAVTTGGINAGDHTAYAGIQTASYNTGLTTANQAVTGLGANSSIGFGD
ncbi:MAG: hypothetical protein Q8M88_14840 [Phenylobacterium sp.]|uniref:hypothetical protein n=1 Tax=Phenylobacterium sp. TaxID=1871053 RepID=UPI00273553E4|nr:hypothetical protein [Phenylobacterium sp.]MDP3175707.1 hypothetical protein [Phenylobacterium sp.]